jgi:hypothetical protein
VKILPQPQEAEAVISEKTSRLKALIAALRQIRKHAKRYWTEYASAAQQRTHNAWLTKFSKETGEDLSHFRINVHSYYDRDDFISTLDATISSFVAVASESDS